MGKLVTKYLARLVGQLDEDKGDTAAEVEALTRNIDHIKQIVSRQQSLVGDRSLVERVEPRVIMEDAIQISTASLGLHNIQIAATRMHGSLHASSDGDHTGAAFFLELPVRAPTPTTMEHKVAS